MTINEDRGKPPVGSSRKPSKTFGTRGSTVVGVVPAPVRRFVVELGGMLQLLGQITRVTLRHPKAVLVPTLDIMYVTLKQSAVPVILSLGGFITFLSVAALVFFRQLGALTVYSAAIMRGLIISFTVWAVALVIAGIIGAALTSELGARRVRDELDAMHVMGVDPIRELVAPRALSAALLTTLMAFPAVAMSVLVPWVGGLYFADMSTALFFATVYEAMSPLEFWLVVLNCLVAGVIIGMVSAYKGMNASGGAEGLGQAVNEAVVYSFLILFITQAIYRGATLGLFELGRYR